MSKEMYAEQVSEAKLQELFSCRFESEDLDFKERMDFTSKKGQIELCKDIIAMANTKGGHLVFGVRDKDFVAVGIPITDYIDSADLSNLLDKYVQEKIDWYLVGRLTFLLPFFHDCFASPNGPAGTSP